MPAEQVAVRHYRARRRLVRAAAVVARRAWRSVDALDLSGSWLAVLPRLLVTVSGAQAAAAQMADGYLSTVLAEQGIDADADGPVVPSALAGVGSDGRDLGSLLYQPVIAAKLALRQGVGVRRAVAAGEATIDLIVRTQVADAGRAADQVALTVRPQVTGYVRMLVGDSCSRCVVLAGARYRWNTGFARHPRCDCVHVPAREDTADDIRTDPRAYFDSLTAAEQDRAFTRAGAQAIRDGANVAQVVNARRGAFGLAPAGARLTAAEVRELRGGRSRGRLQTRDVFGQQLFTTTEGSRRGRGRVRLMPESIYQVAGDDRNEAVRLLRRYGYIT